MEIILKILMYAGIFVIGFIAISLWNFYSVIHPPKIAVTLTPKDFNLPSENISIQTEDNLKLSGWLIEAQPADKEKQALIILHGYPVEKADMLFIASSLYPDFTLLLLDLRSFGESEGKYTTFGIKERGDIKEAVEFLSARGYENIGVFGFSLGGAIGILSAAEDERIGAVASYASFSDAQTLGEDVYTRLFILKKPMVHLILFWSRLFFGESLVDISPLHAIERLRIPVLIVHTTGDEVIPFSHALRLKEALAGNSKAEFYFPEGRPHGDLPAEFHDKLNAFFKKALNDSIPR